MNDPLAPQEQAAALEQNPRRFALLVEYDGAGFAGSQLQSNARTVQSVLEAAIEKATGERSRVAFAGRTDAGVHAIGQVASFVSRTRLDALTLQRALNAWLPEDAGVREASEVDTDFDPRRWALRRHYRYQIDNQPARSVLERGRSWRVASPLDVPAMQAAAQGMLGQHDFAPFASPLDDPNASTQRELFAFDVRERRARVTCDLVANAFLPHQVRRMVGVLVQVGKGKLGVEEYVALLKAAPSSAGTTAPAYGLYLVGVEYATPVFPKAALDSDRELC